MDRKEYEALKNIIKFVKGKSKEIKNNDIVTLEKYLEEASYNLEDDEQRFSSDDESYGKNCYDETC